MEEGNGVKERLVGRVGASLEGFGGEFREDIAEVGPQTYGCFCYHLVRCCLLLSAMLCGVLLFSAVFCGFLLLLSAVLCGLLWCYAMLL